MTLHCEPYNARLPPSTKSFRTPPTYAMHNNEALLDALLDLKHDLGKHLQLPLSLLPKNADAEQVRHAARDALGRTRRGPSGEFPARALWEAFKGETANLLEDSQAFADLELAVQTALAWEHRLLDPSSTHDGARTREAITRDFHHVSDCIAALIAEVKEPISVPR